MKHHNKSHRKIPALCYKYLIAFLFAVSTLVASQWQQNNDIATIRAVQAGMPAEFYSNQSGDDLTKLFVTAIQSAQKTVTLLVYSLTDPAIIRALQDRCNAGINVHIVCDAKASPPYIVSKLGPNAQIIRRFAPGLMHQKLLVIDDKSVWIGSANMTTESLRMHGNLVMALEDPKLADLIKAKASQLKVEGREDSFPMQDFIIGGQKLEFWFLPDNSHAVRRIISLINAAKKTIRIGMFTWTRYDLANEVIKAAQRGIDVEVAIDYHSGKGASAKVAKLLKKNGIPTFFSSSSSLLHHKFLYIDGNTLEHGSANWTKAAFKNNDDCFSIIHQLTPKQQAHMETLWNKIKKDAVNK